MQHPEFRERRLLAFSPESFQGRSPEQTQEVPRPGEKYTDSKLTEMVSASDKFMEDFKHTCGAHEKSTPSQSREWKAFYRDYRDRRNAILASGWTEGNMSTIADQLTGLSHDFAGSLRQGGYGLLAVGTELPRTEPPSAQETERMSEQKTGAKTLTETEYDQWLSEIETVARAAFPRLFSPDVYRDFHPRNTDETKTLWGDIVSRYERESRGNKSEILRRIFKELLDGNFNRDSLLLKNARDAEQAGDRGWMRQVRRVEGKHKPVTEKLSLYQALRAEAVEKKIIAG